MPASREGRITTQDPREAKRERVAKAIGMAKYAKCSNRQLAKILGVDESMVRRHRTAAAPKSRKKRK